LDDWREIVGRHAFRELVTAGLPCDTEREVVCTFDKAKNLSISEASNFIKKAKYIIIDFSSGFWLCEKKVNQS
jgi:hypothetical protein